MSRLILSALLILLAVPALFMVTTWDHFLVGRLEPYLEEK